jgi:hypothetical protein
MDQLLVQLLVIALGLLNLQLIQLITAFKQEKTLVWRASTAPIRVSSFSPARTGVRETPNASARCCSRK